MFFCSLYEVAESSGTLAAFNPCRAQKQHPVFQMKSFVSQSVWLADLFKMSHRARSQTSSGLAGSGQVVCDLSSKKMSFLGDTTQPEETPEPCNPGGGWGGGATTCCSPLITTEKSDSLDHQTAHISFIYQCDRFTPSPNPEAGCGRSGHETGQDAQKALTGDTWCSSIAPLC